MVKVMDGNRWDVNSGADKLHRGTREFLEAIGATVIEGTEREVSATDVNEQGRLLVAESNAPRS